jgi:carbon storage regulator
MLVLSRRKGERIVIGSDIEVVVMEARGDRVRIGIEAPAEVPIHRKEVFDRIEQQQLQQQEDGPGPNLGVQSFVA